MAATSARLRRRRSGRQATYLSPLTQLKPLSSLHSALAARQETYDKEVKRAKVVTLTAREQTPQPHEALTYVINPGPGKAKAARLVPKEEREEKLFDAVAVSLLQPIRPDPKQFTADEMSKIVMGETSCFGWCDEVFARQSEIHSKADEHCMNPQCMGCEHCSMEAKAERVRVAAARAREEEMKKAMQLVQSAHDDDEASYLPPHTPLVRCCTPRFSSLAARCGSRRRIVPCLS